MQLDPGHIVNATESDCWLIHSAGDLYIVVQRSGAGSTLNVYRNQTVVYPTASASVDGNAQTWTVLAGGIPATVTVQQARAQLLRADSNSPSFAETAVLAATTADAQVSVALEATGTLGLQEPLAHIYDASTVQVNLNAVSAAAGQPVSAPIGSGDPQQANQSFTVNLPIAAIGPTAADPTASPTSSLNVYVNGQPWNAVASLLQSGPEATVYVERTNKDGSATVTFGDGVHGARLPSGQDNVVATYLQGGGAATAVAPGALIQALDRPQLVTAVHNPAPALVPQTPPPDQSRNAAVRSLDRTVTVEDYEDLVLAQVGVTSTRVDVLAGPPGRAIVITVALATDAPRRDARQRVRNGRDAQLERSSGARRGRHRGDGARDRTSHLLTGDGRDRAARPNRALGLRRASARGAAVRRPGAVGGDRGLGRGRRGDRRMGAARQRHDHRDVAGCGARDVGDADVRPDGC